ncbi:MAG: hypothetical protein RL307_1267 [Pseudomonadota bacterium]|jgi:hypothetical protein
MSSVIRARRSHRGHGDDEGYWPGYVDALVNVVLNLLFLLAILTLAAFVLGQKVGQNQQSQQSQQSQQTAPARAQAKTPQPALTQRPVRTLTGIAPEKLTVQASTRHAASPNGLAVIDSREAQGGWLISVGTPGNAWLMNQAATPAWFQQLESALNLAQAKGPVSIWTNTDTDPQRQRQDYLRVIQMREWLLRLGVKPEHIQTRLVEGGTVEKEVAPLFIWAQKE